ncbi:MULTISPECIES: hypothetical protein [Butyricimonas]|uniref:Uncharacterized protein n=1 Tax=Butyricimonas faecihominis TaxID=1472416 RepID=A0A7W6HX24_9BACT|nr:MULTISPECIES: hypothetical protein [Butyricimonas]MBB4026560.1 hypothetical protein [Butyricimonas faecihominis]
MVKKKQWKNLRVENKFHTQIFHLSHFYSKPIPRHLTRGDEEFDIKTSITFMYYKVDSS